MNETLDGHVKHDKVELWASMQVPRGAYRGLMPSI